MALWVPIDGQQKEAGDSSDKLRPIQNQCPKLNRDLEWQHRGANGTFHHRLQWDQNRHHICDNFLFFFFLVGNLQMVTACVVCHEHALLCTDATNQTFAQPMCLSQLHSPSFLSEVTNVVAAHCGCSHVADEPKQLIPCFKK